MILYYLIIILFFFIFLYKENFTYFNLNLNLDVPISYNNNMTFNQNIQLKNKTLCDNIFDNRIKLINIANYDFSNNNITDTFLTNNNCCLVQKEFNDGNFTYKYTPFKNEKCNIELYELDHNNKLLFDNVNNWNNKYCNNNHNILGSCRKSNMECVDFITESDCNSINTNAKGDYTLKFDHTNKNNVLSNKTVWSNKTCNNWHILN